MSQRHVTESHVNLSEESDSATELSVMKHGQCSEFWCRLFSVTKTWRDSVDAALKAETQIRWQDMVYPNWGANRLIESIP